MGWTIVVPMFCESGRITRTVETLAGSSLASEELIFVDDGSTDDTLAVLDAALATSGLRAQVLRLPANQGKGAAVRAGVLAATGDVVGFVDADLSSPVSAITAVFGAVEAGAPVAIATRAAAASTITTRQSSGRENAGKSFNLLLRLLGLTTMHDTQCGLKAFERSVGQRLFSELRTVGFAFDVEVLVRAGREGLAIVEVPAEWAHVEASGVHPVVDGARMAWDVVRLRWVLRHRR